MVTQRRAVCAIQTFLQILPIWLIFATSSAYSEGHIPDIKSGLGRDHAELEEGQSRKTQELVKKLFYSQNGQITLEKVEALLERLHVERQRVEKDMAESALLERVETDLKDPQKSIR